MAEDDCAEDWAKPATGTPKAAIASAAVAETSQDRFIERIIFLRFGAWFLHPPLFSVVVFPGSAGRWYYLTHAKRAMHNFANWKPHLAPLDPECLVAKRPGEAYS